MVSYGTCHYSYHFLYPLQFNQFCDSIKLLQLEPISNMLFEANLETASNFLRLCTINREVMMN